MLQATVALAVTAAAMDAGEFVADIMTDQEGRLRDTRETLYEDTDGGFNWYVPSNSHRPTGLRVLPGGGQAG